MGGYGRQCKKQSVWDYLWIFDNNASEWYNSLVSYTTGRTGTGNFGGRYYGSDTVGRYLYPGAMIDERDVNRGVVTSGQWSTDDSK